MQSSFYRVFGPFSTYFWWILPQKYCWSTLKTLFLEVSRRVVSNWTRNSAKKCCSNCWGKQKIAMERPLLIRRAFNPYRTLENVTIRPWYCRKSLQFHSNYVYFLVAGIKKRLVWPDKKKWSAISERLMSVASTHSSMKKLNCNECATGTIWTVCGNKWFRLLPVSSLDFALKSIRRWRVVSFLTLDVRCAWRTLKSAKRTRHGPAHRTIFFISTACWKLYVHGILAHCVGTRWRRPTCPARMKSFIGTSCECFIE